MRYGGKKRRTEIQRAFFLECLEYDSCEEEIMKEDKLA